MELVQQLTISKKSKSSSGKPKNAKRVHKKGKRSEEEQRYIEELIDENNEIYKRAKERGRALPEEKARFMEIREELIRMKAI